MITFDEARWLAAAAVEPEWDPESQGTLFPSFEGAEDSTHYAVNVGNEEYLIDGNRGYMIMDAPLVLVDKESGELEVTTYLVIEDRVDKMTPLTSE